MRYIYTVLLLSVCLALNLPIKTAAQEDMKAHRIEATKNPPTQSPDSIQKSPRLLVGGYGEVVMQRMFYSDNVARYFNPESYKNDTYGRFDLPHVVFYMSYDFGHGWKM